MGLSVLLAFVLPLVVVVTIVEFALVSAFDVVSPTAEFVASGVVTLVLVPIFSAAGVVVYTDFRVRKESLTLGELATEFGRGG